MKHVNEVLKDASQFIVERQPLKQKQLDDAIWRDRMKRSPSMKQAEREELDRLIQEFNERGKPDNRQKLG